MEQTQRELGVKCQVRSFETEKRAQGVSIRPLLCSVRTCRRVAPGESRLHVVHLALQFLHLLEGFVFEAELVLQLPPRLRPRSRKHEVTRVLSSVDLKVFFCFLFSGMSLASVGSSTTKTFINSLTHCHETFHRHSWIPEEEQSRLFYFFSSATMRLTPAVLSEISSDAQNDASTVLQTFLSQCNSLFYSNWDHNLQNEQ